MVSFTYSQQSLLLLYNQRFSYFFNLFSEPHTLDCKLLEEKDHPCLVYYFLIQC